MVRSHHDNHLLGAPTPVGHIAGRCPTPRLVPLPVPVRPRAHNPCPSVSSLLIGLVHRHRARSPVKSRVHRERQGDQPQVGAQGRPHLSCPGTDHEPDQPNVGPGRGHLHPAALRVRGRHQPGHRTHRGRRDRLAAPSRPARRAGQDHRGTDRLYRSVPGTPPEHQYGNRWVRANARSPPDHRAGRLAGETWAGLRAPADTLTVR